MTTSGQDEAKALAVHEAIMGSRQADFRGNRMKEKAITIAIKKVLPILSDEELKTF